MFKIILYTITVSIGLILYIIGAITNHLNQYSDIIKKTGVMIIFSAIVTYIMI